MSLALRTSFAIASLIVVHAAPLPKTAAELYGLTNLWSLRLNFDGADWKAMEPAGGGGFPPFGRPGRGPGPGGPGGFRMPGPSMFLMPSFLKDGDSNGDKSLSRDEFLKLGDKWFAVWDKEKRGKVSQGELAMGLNATFAPPFGGPGPGAGPGPGPGGPPGGFRMTLQGPEGGRNGIAARAGVEYKYVKANLEFEGAALNNIAARYKGNGTFLESRNSEKRPFKLDLNKNVKGQQLAGISTLNLHNGVTDPSYMNEALAFKLYRDAGVPAPRTAYARVKIDAPPEHKDDYFGLYILVENVDDDFTREYFKAKGGALYKPVTPSLFEFLGEDWAAYKQTYDPKDDPSKEENARVIETCRFVSKSTDEEFAARLGDYIDLEEFARYMAVTVFLSDLDGILGPGQNFYIFLHPADKKFRFIAWDQDHSFGQMRGSQEDRERLSIERPWQGENRFLERVFKVESFKKLYLARLEEFSETLFKPERFHAAVDAMAPLLRNSVKEESDARFEAFSSAIAGKESSMGGFGMRAGAKPIKGFVTPRAESIREQLAGKSKGNTVGMGGFGPGPMRGPGGRGPEGPGAFVAGSIMNALDSNKDGELAAAEVRESFSNLFAKWSGKGESISEEQLRAGIDQDFAPRGFGPPPR